MPETEQGLELEEEEDLNQDESIDEEIQALEEENQRLQAIH